MRHSPRNLRIACDHRGLTHFGGVYFFHEFLQVLKLRHFLARNLRYPRRNHRYSLSQMILALVYPLVLGLDRLETASFLRFNGAFQYLTGLPSLPDAQTLRRFLLHAPDSFWEQLHRVNDRLLQHFIHLPDHRSRLIFDLDSSVVTVFGRQENAEVGYNPRYRGKRSYNPLLCIDWETHRVNIDYHVAFDHHWYSVPYQLTQQEVEVRATAATVEIFHRGVRVASHARSQVPHEATTVHDHRPKAHQRHLEWTPSRLVDWAKTI